MTASEGRLSWPRVGWAGIAVAAALASGCQSSPKDVLVPPQKIVAPYDASGGEALWAIAPVRNESGTTALDTGALGDKLAAAAEEIEGVRCVPLNRTLDAMRTLQMQAVRTPGDARKLAQAMGVDGVIVPTVTAWDPYTPKIGLSAALYANPTWLASGRTTLDPRALESSPTVATGAGTRYADSPTAVASEHLDGKNNQVLMDLKSFADGRERAPNAYGWRRYLASMDLYSEFAAYRILDGIIREEWVRTAISRRGTASADAAPRDGRESSR